MLILVTYDVSTETKEGRGRLRKIAKLCTDYGQRVQNSVFECLLSSVEFCKVKAKLTDVIDEKTDSLRFYLLGNRYDTKVEHIGAKKSYNPEDPFII